MTRGTLVLSLSVSRASYRLSRHGQATWRAALALLLVVSAACKLSRLNTVRRDADQHSYAGKRIRFRRTNGNDRLPSSRRKTVSPMRTSKGDLYPNANTSSTTGR